MTSLIADKRQELFVLCRKYHVQRLELFGSAATDNFDRNGSDIDFLVIFELSTPTEHADRYFGLLAALQDLFARAVDLVELRAITNPYFKEEIELTRAVIYGA